jgi:DNA topoisomerase-6 subunit A
MRKEQDIPALSHELCMKLLKDLEAAKRPHLEAIKCNLDNCIYDPKIGYLTPGDKKVVTELNVSSVKKLSRALFVLEILLRNLETGAVNTKREIYYIAKGEIKNNPDLSPLDFDGQDESDAIIDFICEIMELYREDLNCYANDRGGQTYSQQLVVTETLVSGKKAVIDLSMLGTSPFQPKNKPQDLKLSIKKGEKIDFCLIVESEGTANTLVANGFTERNKCILLGAQGVPSNAVRGWCKTIQDQLSVPMYFFSDLDAYSLQNILRVAMAGSAASLIRNSDFSAPDIRFLGVLPEDIKKYGLLDYAVNEKDPVEYRSLKKAQDALKNDPFFLNKKNKALADVLRWLVENKRRCEQQSYFSVNPKDPLMPEKIIIDKIKKGRYIK